MPKPIRKKIQSPFAKNLKAILNERGLSQKAAAEVANVTPATLNDWLAGSNPSDHIAVQRLCRALGCSFEWLLTGAETRIESKSLSMTELFDSEPDPSFSGVFEISARRLRRKN
ncbi:MAG: helix-turn-helix domain-containing protein [Bdellovibrionales bacterium]